jgi:hypothetical protein
MIPVAAIEFTGIQAAILETGVLNHMGLAQPSAATKLKANRRHAFSSY